jgi:glycosyltransferase involved in cell wall biosynthesis
VSVAVRAHGRNIGKNITLALASESISLELKAEMVEHEFEISLSNRTNFICFQGIDHSASGSLNDARCIGIGIAKIRITPVSPPNNSAIQNNAQLPPLSLDTPVYTSVFNPRDNRKNWEDIISAFCFAFQDKTEATLILKMTCGSLEDFLEDFFRLLCQLQPFKCRIIAIQGYLAAGDLQNLRDVTKFIVNASHGEGQCLPLVEFMAQGTPAIAPQHTALADYINEKCAFIVSSAPELTFWPHEPEQKLTTLWYRPDWESLRDAYTKSYDLLMLPQGDYTQMSLSAVESIRAYCSEEVLLETMQQFLARVKDSEVRLS